MEVADRCKVETSTGLAVDPAKDEQTLKVNCGIELLTFFTFGEVRLQSYGYPFSHIHIILFIIASHFIEVGKQALNK